MTSVQHVVLGTLPDVADQDPASKPLLEPTQMMVLGVCCFVAIVFGVTLRATTLGSNVSTPPAGAALASTLSDLVAEPSVRTIDPYEGQGAWVDAFDYVPAYANDAPVLDVTALDDMVDAGVETVFLQAARDDERAEGLIVDPSVVARWLVEAHRRDLAVVAWFLPRHVDTDRDLAHLEALLDFEVLGHTFDGIAVDIEATTNPDPGARSASLIELSLRLREAAGDQVVGAVVLPPVLLEVVNPDFWPTFPWSEIAPVYDVWLPMAYWSDRRADSGYRDGFTYFEESTRRLRANLADPDALVHGVGGIGGDISEAEIGRFGEALTATSSIGGSIYDWAVLPVAQRPSVQEAVGG